MIRLFIALDLSIQTKERLEKFTIDLNLPDPRILKASNLHITLKFLGYTEDNLLEPIDKVLKEVAQRHAGFDIKLDNLGVFPSKKRARVFWIGSKDNERVSKLVEDIDQSLKSFNFETEKRAYKIHLTLARFKNQPDLSKYFDKSFKPKSEQIDHFILFESKLSPKGAQYRALNKYFLKSA